MAKTKSSWPPASSATTNKLVPSKGMRSISISSRHMSSRMTGRLKGMSLTAHDTRMEFIVRPLPASFRPL